MLYFSLLAGAGRPLTKHPLIGASYAQSAQGAGVAQICPRVDLASRGLMSRALEDYGFASVRGWGVKTMELLHYAIACGMNGATVNWPHRAIEELQSF